MSREYRYELRRQWDEGASTVVWVMLNPSTADEVSDDPTIRRVVSFSKGWGFRECVVLNLFAMRATQPAALLTAVDPVGPENDAKLKLWAMAGYEMIAAWGAVPKRLRSRVGEVLRITGRTFTCLGETKDRQPRHPLYVRGDALLQTWKP